MKKLYLTVASLAVGSLAMAQTTYTENFDSLTASDYLCTQVSEWTTWTNAPGTAEDAYVSDEQASSASNSVKLESATGMGPTDLLLPLGDWTSGTFDYSMKMYVASGNGGYFNVQHFSSPGVEWAAEIYFGTNGTGSILAGGDSAAITFIHDAWFDVAINVDLGTDQATFSYGGTPLLTWDFSLDAQGNQGTSQVGGINIFAAAPAGESCLYYIDDVSYTHTPDNVSIEEAKQTSFSLYPNPSDGLINVELDANGTTSTYRVLDITGKVVASNRLEAGLQSVDLTNLTAGVYIFELTQGTAIESKKIVLR